MTVNFSDHYVVNPQSDFLGVRVRKTYLYFLSFLPQGYVSACTCARDVVVLQTPSFLQILYCEAR